MKNMTREELVKAARKYDQVQNEGAEGYNPYRSELERRQIEAEAARPKTREDRKAAIYRELDRKDCSIARESGTYNQAAIDALRAEMKAIESEEAAEFAAEWTAEVTTARRQEWNNFVRSLMDNKGQISGKDQPKVWQRQREQGWNIDDLKKAIKLNNL